MNERFWRNLIILVAVSVILWMLILGPLTWLLR